MNIEDKINLLNGKDVWHTYNIDRLNVKSIMMADGPHGLRKQVDSLDNIGARGSYPATLFPAAATAACTFYPLIIQKMGEAIGREARSAGVHVVLGPGINIKRNPLCGRNFEYFSEDPYLAG
ncbi:MAG: glycoside hydrolase family 3 N-terminal domain-containing protein, partial [Bacilli bacterium]